MRKKPKVKGAGRNRTTVIVLCVGLPLLTLALALAAAKLMLGGVLPEERTTAAACTIAGVCALLGGLFAALRAPQKKLLCGLTAAAAYACALLLGNLLFFGEGYGGVFSVTAACAVGGVLGSFTGAAKRRKYA